MNTEDLIRESLRKQADLAPQPYAVLAALHKPRRGRKPLLVAVAVVASVLAAVVLAVHRVPAEESQPVTSAPPFYQPTWLPDGFTEQSLDLGDAYYLRAWKNGDQSVSLAVNLNEADQLGRTDDQVDLGRLREGFYGYREDPAVDTILSWAEDGNLLSVFVRGPADGRQVARRVAMSLSPNSRSRPVEVISPPQRITDGADRVEQGWTGTSPTDWTIEFAYTHQARASVLRLTSAAPDTTGGQVVRARGVDATYVPPRPRDGGTTDPLLVVPVGNAFLTIGGKPSSSPFADVPEWSVDEMVSIADTTTVRNPDVSWLGRR